MCALGKAISGIAELEARGYKWLGVGQHNCELTRQFAPMAPDDSGLLNPSEEDMF